MLDVNLSQAIRSLRQKGHGIREIARQTGVSRNTVRQYVNDGDHGMVKPVETRAYSLDAGDSDKLKQLYITTKGNCAVIHRRILAQPEEYGFESGFTVSDRSIRRYYQARHPELVSPTNDPTFEFDTHPGAQLQIDFVTAKFHFAGKERPETVYIFEAVYAWSRKAYVRICPDMTHASWLLSIADCLAKYGIPRQILCDNDRSLVIKHTRSKKSPAVRFHPAFQWLCRPLGTQPIACVPRRAKTKGRVERFGRYLQENGLADCAVDRDQIPDRLALQKALDRWIETVADRRLCQDDNKVYRPIHELYEEEKKLLRFPVALKSTFDITTWTALVNKDGQIGVYGVTVQLAKELALHHVQISMRVNGEIIVMSQDGSVVHQSVIPEGNRQMHARDAAAPKALKPSASMLHEKSLKEYDDVI